MPEGAFLEDATWADNSPVDVDRPQTFTFDESALATLEEHETSEAGRNFQESDNELLRVEANSYDNFIVPVESVVGAPYSYDYSDAEKINLNSGAMLYETVDYTLPGKNGLDLVIGRRYSSEDAMGSIMYKVTLATEIRETSFGPTKWYTEYWESALMDYSDALTLYNRQQRGQVGPYWYFNPLSEGDTYRTYWYTRGIVAVPVNNSSANTYSKTQTEKSHTV